MNQEKIGKFILSLRKAKNMTQQELANKIGVTDRAISKWENGRGLPDLSLMQPLCNELEITINELINGEKINKKVYKEVLEKNIIKTIDYSIQTQKKQAKKFKIVIGIMIILIIVLLLMFLIDIRRMNQNKPVIFSTWGYKYYQAIDLEENKIYSAVKNYLLKTKDNNTHNEKTFISMKVYLLEEKERNLHYNVYAWVLEEKYYLENNEIKKDSSSSIPYKFVVKYIDDEYEVTDSRIPRDGSLYDKDMKNIFPYWVRKDMDNIYIDGTLEKLNSEIEEQVKLYFH